MRSRGAKIGKILLALLASSYFFYYAQTTGDWHFLDNVNLIIHEAGHVVFSPFGRFVYLLGGSLFQTIVPIVFSVYFFVWRKDQYSGSLLLFWVGQNLINVSVYAGDAVVMQLPLLGGDSSTHDWNAILSMLNALQYTHAVSTAIFTAGFVTICAGAALSLYYACQPVPIRQRAGF
ncbi:MAG: hypothetical protein JWL88_343 [Parcubacteria group bacterium]|nr:hypothetical protein [Parcubacteria group bacterium]